MYPARDAVEQLHEIWVEATDGEDREREFSDLVERACEDAATEEVHPYRRGIVNPGQTVSVVEEHSESGTRTVIIIESPKPERVVEAAEYAPERVTVEWVRDISKIDNFTQYDEDTVYLVSEGDPEKDLRTYQKLDEFSDDLLTSGAGAVKFVSKPHRFLDRVLSAESESAKGVFSRSMDNIVPDRDSKGNPIQKPAKSKPRSNARGGDDTSQVEQRERILADMGNRTLVELCGDRKVDNDNLIAGVKKRWDAKKIFNYGNAIARVKEDQVYPQDKSMWKNTLVEACKIVRRDQKGNTFNTEVPSYCVDSTLARVDDFTVLEGIKHAPFVRSDGTVCQTPGYDAESKMKLYLSENLSGIEVPENPTQEQVFAAREVLEDWLYDFFQIMPTQTDRANALALVLTPFILMGAMSPVTIPAALVQQITEALSGRHDFSAFALAGGSHGQPFRTILAAFWEERGAELLCGVLEDVELRERLSRAGRARAAELGWHQAADTLVSAVETALAHASSKN